MAKFLTYLLEANFGNVDFKKHNWKYPKMVLDYINMSSSLPLGRNVIDTIITVDENTKKLLNQLFSSNTLNSITVDMFNEITLQNSKPFKWNEIYKGQFSGKTSNKNEDMESVISYGYNLSINDVTLIQDFSSNIINYYNTEYKQILPIVECLTTYFPKNLSPLSKLKTSGLVVSDEFIKLGKFEIMNNKPNPTPKTDIISANKKIRISCKKADESQLMSGAGSESLAVLKIAANNDRKKYHKLYQMIEADIWKSYKLNDIASDDSILNTTRTQMSDLSKYITYLATTDSEFRYRLLHEALTGTIKFNGSPEAIPNYVLEWSMTDSNANNIYTINEYIEHLKHRKVRYLISYKSGGSRKYVSLRIAVG